MMMMLIIVMKITISFKKLLSYQNIVCSGFTKVITGASENEGNYHKS